MHASLLFTGYVAAYDACNPCAKPVKVVCPKPDPCDPCARRGFRWFGWFRKEPTRSYYYPANYNTPYYTTNYYR